MWGALAVLLFATLALAAEPYRATSTHPFDDVPKWSKRFDDPQRDAWQKPDETVAALAITKGMTVADLGAGTGYFSKRLSQAVGETGTVFAVDVEPNLVVHLRDRAEREKTKNVIPVLASFDDPRLPARAVDLVFMLDTFHHLDHRLGYLKHLRTRLRDGGRIAVIDWKEGELDEGPPPDHKIARGTVVKEMTDAGYELVAEPAIGLPYHFFLVFR
ncbi:MAG: class I SAM-dependent methyltransferase, partial [Candidatus Binatia bacterium]